MSGALGPGTFAAGLALLAVTVGCGLATAAVIVRRRLSDLDGAPQVVAFCLLAIGATIAAHLLPLLLGVLTRGTVVIAAAGLLVAVLLLTPDSARGAADAASSPPEPPVRRFGALIPAAAPERLSWLLAGAGVLLTLASWIAYLEVSATLHPISVDTLSFHLPGVIRYIQSGTLWQTAQYLPGQAQANYPQYGDLLLLAVVLPWHSVAFVRYVDPLLLGVAAISVYAIARELRAPAGIAALAATALMAIRPALAPALPDVLTDPGALAGLAGGTLFLIRHWRTGQRRDLWLAGLGLGLALGTKWYGLTDVPAVILVWFGARGLAGHPRRAVISDLGVLAAGVLLTGGVWMLRNLLLTGNPVFDYRVAPFGLSVFPAPPDPIRAGIGYSLSHYLTDPGVLRRYVWPVFRSDFGVIGALIAAGGAYAAVVAIAARLRRTRLPDPRPALLAVAAAALACAYALTPYSAQGLAGAPVLVNANTRYGVPALLLAAPLLAWAGGRLGRARHLLEVLLLVAAVAGLRSQLAVGAGRAAVSAVAVVVLAAVVAVAMRSPAGTGRVRVRGTLIAVLAIAAAGAAGLAYHYQRVLASRPYLPDDPSVDFVLAHAGSGTRIGLTGTWTAQGLIPVAPVFGPRLQNQVGYVGPFVAHRLEQYPSARAFVAALQRGRYQLLIVGTGFPPRPDPIQERWSRQAGFTVIAQSPRLVLLRAPAG